MKDIRSAVVLFIYKRPKHTLRLIKILNKIKINKIYIVADGYKNNEEKKLIFKTRNLIYKIKAKKIIKIFFNKNIGLRINFELGLKKVFEKEKNAIILEDDMLPSLSFFYYCDILLKKYYKNKKINMICGTNFKSEITKSSKYDYFISKYPNFWGWATWNDRWKTFDNKMKKWNKFKNSSNFYNKFQNKNELNFWKERFNFHKKNPNKGTWDFPFFLTHFFYNKKTIIPKINLIKNIGYDSPTSVLPKKTSKLKTGNLNFPLKHPNNFNENIYYDNFCSAKLFSKSKLLVRIKNKIKLIIKKLI